MKIILHFIIWIFWWLLLNIVNTINTIDKLNNLSKESTVNEIKNSIPEKHLPKKKLIK